MNARQVGFGLVGFVCWLFTGGCCPRVEAAGFQADSLPVLVSSPEPGWPQWRGPRRDGICDETGLLSNWPAGGPKLLWKSGGLGKGYSAPIITGGRIYLAGDVADELIVFALDLEGRPVWKAPNGRAWKGPYPGARAACAYADGRLFHLNAHGRVACFEAATGKELWSVSLQDRFGGKVNTWAFSECLLVDAGRVLVTPGGTKALMAALDAKTGETVWASEPLRLEKSTDPAHQRVEGEGTDAASYASPILFTWGGRRHLVNCSLRHVFGVDAETGKLLWTRPLRTRYQVIAATPVLIKDAIFVTAPDTQEARMLRLLNTDRGVEVETVWTTRLDTCHGCLVYKNGAVYGAWYRNGKGFACMDPETGEIRYDLRELAKGSILYADGRLYCLSEEGQMALLKPSTSGFEIAGRFSLTDERQSDVWTHPVILEGKLYLRNHETLFCYDIRAK